MPNNRVQIEDCREKLESASRILTEGRVCYHASPIETHSLSEARKAISDILRFSEQKKYVTENQLELLTQLVNLYNNILSLNNGYERGFAEATVSLLEEFYEATEKYGKGNRSLRFTRTKMMKRAEQIKNGEYFWEAHLSPAKEFCASVQNGKKDRKFSDLEKRINETYDRCKLPFEKQALP